MSIESIKNDEDYRATLREIESLMNAKADTPQGARFAAIVMLVEAYERAHYPIGFPSVADLISKGSA